MAMTTMSRGFRCASGAALKARREDNADVPRWVIQAAITVSNLSFKLLALSF
jgi:hypothetical protein